MRIQFPGLALIALFAGGCCTCPPPEIIGPAWDTPEAAFRTFRAAVIGHRPDLVFESFSPWFRQDYGVPDSRTFRAGYRSLLESGDLDDVETVLAKATITNVRVGPDPATGLRWARVTVSAYDREGTFILVEIPTATVGTDIPGYGPQKADYAVPGPGFGGHLRVDDGIVRIALDATTSGVAETSEISEFRLHHQWLLRDIQDLPVDVRALMDRLRGSAGTAP